MRLVRRLRGCLSRRTASKLVPLEQIDFTPEVLDHIQRNEQLYRVELDDVAAEELGIITGSAMIKDETRCIRCGLCAERCPGAGDHDGGVSPGDAASCRN